MHSTGSHTSLHIMRDQIWFKVWKSILFQEGAMHYEISCIITLCIMRISTVVCVAFRNILDLGRSAGTDACQTGIEIFVHLSFLSSTMFSAARSSLRASASRAGVYAVSATWYILFYMHADSFIEPSAVHDFAEHELKSQRWVSRSIRVCVSWLLNFKVLLSALIWAQQIRACPSWRARRPVSSKTRKVHVQHRLLSPSRSMVNV